VTRERERERERKLTNKKNFDQTKNVHPTTKEDDEDDDQEEFCISLYSSLGEIYDAHIAARDNKQHLWRKRAFVSDLRATTTTTITS